MKHLTRLIGLCLAALLLVSATHASDTTNLERKNQYGETQLMLAIKKEDKNHVRELLSRGANVNARDSDNNTPLILAAYTGNYEICELLINSGADPSLRRNGNLSAVDVARINGYRRIASLILNAADVNQRDQMQRKADQEAEDSKRRQSRLQSVIESARVDENSTADNSARGNGGLKSLSPLSGGNYTATCNNGKYGLITTNPRPICASGAGKNSKCRHDWTVEMAGAYLCE